MEERREVLDQGDANLINDVLNLLREIEELQFHDFKNTNYPAPKVALAHKLEEMAAFVRAGRYDN